MFLHSKFIISQLGKKKNSIAVFEQKTGRFLELDKSYSRCNLPYLSPSYCNLCHLPVPPPKHNHDSRQNNVSILADSEKCYFSKVASIEIQIITLLLGLEHLLKNSILKFSKVSLKMFFSKIKTSNSTLKPFVFYNMIFIFSITNLNS